MSDGTKLVETWSKFKDRGWMTGDAGAIALLCVISENSKKIYVTPDKPRKQILTLNDLFTLRDLYGSQEIQNPLNEVEDGLVLSKWAPTLLEIIAKFPKSTCVAQVCTTWSTLASRLALHAWKKKSEAFPNVLRISHWGLLNDIGVKQELLLPIINYTDSETMQAAAKDALTFYPQTCAILIRDYGMVTWGQSLLDLERSIEVIEKLCELQVREFNLFNRPD